MGKPGALDLSVTSPLNPLTLPEAGMMAGAAAKAMEERKLKANGSKCADLGWACVPVVAESYGAWGMEAVDFFSKLAFRIATSVGKSKSVVLHEIYGRTLSEPMLRQYCQGAYHLSMGFSSHALNLLCAVATCNN